MKRSIVYSKPEAIMLAVSYVVLIAANALGEIFKFGGVTAGSVSNEVFAWFAPAGYVFMIWSLIYIGLVVWLVRLARTGREPRQSGGNTVRKESLVFVVSCVLNIIWLALWHLRIFPASIVVIVLLFASVAVLYLMTRKRSKSWLDRAPISLYASWLAVAMIANIAHVATRATDDGNDVVSAVSTIVLLAVFAGIAFLMRRKFGDYVFGLVVAWAGIGIGVHLIEVAPVVGVIAILISTVGVAAALVPWDVISSGTAGRQTRRK